MSRSRDGLWKIASSTIDSLPLSEVGAETVFWAKVTRAVNSKIKQQTRAFLGISTYPPHLQSGWGSCQLEDSGEGPFTWAGRESQPSGDKYPCWPLSWTKPSSCRRRSRQLWHRRIRCVLSPHNKKCLCHTLG